MDNPAPVITITRPAGGLEEPTDLLHQRAASRTPVLVGVLLLAVLIAGLQLQRVQHDRELARRAVRAVSLQEFNGTSFVVGKHLVYVDLANAGPDPVTVISVQIPGFPALRAQPVTIAAHDNDLVSLPLTGKCPTAACASASRRRRPAVGSRT